jgi:hypothetical protein
MVYQAVCRMISGNNTKEYVPVSFPKQATYAASWNACIGEITYTHNLIQLLSTAQWKSRYCKGT